MSHVSFVESLGAHIKGSQRSSFLLLPETFEREGSSTLGRTPFFFFAHFKELPVLEEKVPFTMLRSNGLIGARRPLSGIPGTLGSQHSGKKLIVTAYSPIARVPYGNCLQTDHKVYVYM